MAVAVVPFGFENILITRELWVQFKNPATDSQPVAGLLLENNNEGPRSDRG